MELYNKVCLRTSKNTTNMYSTSFSLGIRALSKDIQRAIYSLYGYVRFADEIVDTFHHAPQKELLDEFRADTHKAIANAISTNPILHSFQNVVNEYQIDHDLIDQFLHSMEMDLSLDNHNQASYEEYILGSAEVVGLMCLKVFCKGDRELYNSLKANAMSLGSAFQKVNFLRDLKADHQELGRSYFPGVDLSQFDAETKREIETDIEKDLAHAYQGILRLPKNSRFGVYLAYIYYRKLFQKIKRTAANRIMAERIRVPNNRKFRLLIDSYIRHSFNLL